MKARDLLAVLMREPLNYAIVRQRGSHRRLKAADRPAITFAFHDCVERGPTVVRKILWLFADVALEHYVPAPA